LRGGSEKGEAEGILRISASEILRRRGQVKIFALVGGPSKAGGKCKGGGRLIRKDFTHGAAQHTKPECRFGRKRVGGSLLSKVYGQALGKIDDPPEKLGGICTRTEKSDKKD